MHVYNSGEKSGRTQSELLTSRGLFLVKKTKLFLCEKDVLHLKFYIIEFLNEKEKQNVYKCLSNLN